MSDFGFFRTFKETCQGVSYLGFQYLQFYTQLFFLSKSMKDVRFWLFLEHLRKQVKGFPVLAFNIYNFTLNNFVDLNL